MIEFVYWLLAALSYPLLAGIAIYVLMTTGKGSKPRYTGLYGDDTVYSSIWDKWHREGDLGFNLSGVGFALVLASAAWPISILTALVGGIAFKLANNVNKEAL